MRIGRERIEAVLGCLIGRTFWGHGRAVSLLTFQFGGRRSRVDRRGEAYEVGEYALHTESPWRLRGPDGIVTGSGDRFWPAGVSADDGSGWDWDGRGPARCDEQLDAHFAMQRGAPSTVEAVEVDGAGGFRLYLSDGCILEVFPDDSRGGEDWRLLSPGSEEAHFVVEGGRVTQDVNWA
jgi:hypothetical protein